MPEAAKASVNKVWAKWESQVVNGIFPLRRFLDQSDHSVVFLTECKAQRLSEAAIKIIPADPALAETQLAHWKAASALAHPHLIRLFDSGRCQLGGYPFLYIVMELAEQTLAQVLPKRALTLDEVREMLGPTLETLAFLHDRHLVHGQLKPANLLVVHDRLKLASDTIRPVAKPSGSIARPSVYDPPESRDGKITVAGDMWGLGATVLEALTQLPPPWPGERTEPISLPASVPAECVELIRRCLTRSAGARPSRADFEAWLNPVTRRSVDTASVPGPDRHPAAPPAPQTSPAPLVPSASQTSPAPSASKTLQAPPAPQTLQAPPAPQISHGPAAPPATHPLQAQSALPASHIAQRTVSQQELALTQASAGPDSARNGRLPVTARALPDPPEADTLSAPSTVEKRPSASATRTRIEGTAEQEDSDSRYSRLPVSSIVVFLAVLIVAWAGVHMFYGRTPPPTPPVGSQPSRVNPVSPFPGVLPPSTSPAGSSTRVNADPRGATGRAAPRSSEQTSPAIGTVPTVVHEEIPTISAGARETIQGRIKVAVRVTVDRTGNVVAESVETAGPSRYFTRLAREAARKWKFSPADDRAPHEWLLRFEFSRAGVTAHGVPRT